MPSTQELLILFLAIFVLWIFLKVVRVAIRVMFFLIMLAIIGGVLFFVFAR